MYGAFLCCFYISSQCPSYSFFFFNDTATTEIYTLSLHDALPIWVGTRLVEAVEHRLISDGARLVVVETSSLPEYASTRAFYERRGYTRGATVPGYYAPGDDLVIYFKDLANGVVARTPA